MLMNCLKCIFVVFETIKKQTGEKTNEIGEKGVGILLYSKNIVQNLVLKFDQAGEGDTTIS